MHLDLLVAERLHICLEHGTHILESGEGVGLLQMPVQTPWSVCHQAACHPSVTSCITDSAGSDLLMFCLQGNNSGILEFESKFARDFGSCYDNSFIAHRNFQNTI